MPSSSQSMRCGSFALPLRIVEAHLAIALGILGPALAHLDEEKEMDGRANHRADLGAGGSADLLDGAAFGAEHDLALAFALDVDRLLHPDAAVGKLLPVGSLDRQRVGELLMEAQEQ